MRKKLSKILDKIIKISVKDDCFIQNITIDSRSVNKGSLFCAYQGYQYNGNDFISEAIDKGATAIITDDKARIQQEQFRAIFYVENLRDHLSQLASNFFNHPSKSLKVIGVTGTNGKTSFCHLLAQALTNLDEKVAIIGTLGNGILGEHHNSGLTTPNPIEIQSLLADFLRAGAKYVVMEASSHGISQKRVDAVQFDTTVFSNLSHDHLDYHGDMLAYGNAKKRLFTLPNIKHRIFNYDDEFGKQLIEEFQDSKNVYIFSTKSIIDNSHLPAVYAKSVHMSIKGLTASIHSPWGDGLLHANLLGSFSISNLLPVIAALGIYGYRFSEILKSISQLKPINGRMQLFSVANKPHVVVDFAHTPDSLKQVLETLRCYTKGELWCLFGCGGNRDQSKRPLMGQIAETYADNVIITDDNPRDEEPSAIAMDILQNMVEPERVIIEHDRARAIKHAIECAKPEDIILIAGKGHENYQIYGHNKNVFSDEVEVQMLLSEKN